MAVTFVFCMCFFPDRLRLHTGTKKNSTSGYSRMKEMTRSPKRMLRQMGVACRGDSFIFFNQRLGGRGSILFPLCRPKLLLLSSLFSCRCVRRCRFASMALCPRPGPSSAAVCHGVEFSSWTLLVTDQGYFAVGSVHVDVETKKKGSRSFLIGQFLFYIILIGRKTFSMRMRNARSDEQYPVDGVSP